MRPHVWRLSLCDTLCVLCVLCVCVLSVGKCLRPVVYNNLARKKRSPSQDKEALDSWPPFVEYLRQQSSVEGTQSWSVAASLAC